MDGGRPRRALGCDLLGGARAWDVPAHASMMRSSRFINAARTLFADCFTMRAKSGADSESPISAFQIVRSKSAAGPASLYVPNSITRHLDRNRGSRLSVPFAVKMKIVFGGKEGETALAGRSSRRASLFHPVSPNRSCGCLIVRRVSREGGTHGTWFQNAHQTFSSPGVWQVLHGLVERWRGRRGCLSRGEP